MTVRAYKAEDKTAWDGYVQNHPDSTIFHLTAWKEVIEESFGHKSFYLVADTGTIAGILPLFEIKSFLFGHYLVSNPFAELGGVIADTLEIQDALIKKAIKIAEERNCEYLELRNRTQYPGLVTKSLYFNFRRKISSDHGENLKAIPRKSRAMVRKAIKAKLVSEMGDHLFPEFYSILAASFHRLGTPIFSRQYLANLLAKKELKTLLLIVRNPEGKTGAGVMSFFFKDQVVPYYAGSDFTLRSLGPNDFIYWELMKYGAEQGYRIFDYGRSKLGTGSFSFKKNWGFKPELLAYQYHLVKGEDLPNLSPANLKYRKKIELWQKMPHGLTTLIGPFISRNLA